MVMMTKVAAMPDRKVAFSTVAPDGFYLALRIGFFAPEEEIVSFPDAWVQHYTRNALALTDPLMRWATTNSGVCRWSDVTTADPLNVLGTYRKFGMKFGVVVSLPGTGRDPKRSCGIFAKRSSEFSNEEIAAIVNAMKAATSGEVPVLTDAQIEVLRLVSAGVRYKNIADRLGISESAVKARLKSATLRMEAKTAAQAAATALAKGLL